MASNNIKGITIEIGGDTTKLGKALEESNSKSRSLGSELKGINSLLKFDPSNTELLAQKQKVLADAISNAKSKLDTLKQAESQVQEQFAKGEVSEAQMRDLQREITSTESKLQSYERSLADVNSESSKLKATISDQTSEMNGLKEKYVDIVLAQGKNSSEAQELKAKLQSLNTELGENKSKLSGAETAANEFGNAEQDASKKAESAANGGFTVLKGMIANLASNVIQGAISKLKELSSEALESADTIQKLSDVTGMSTDSIQEWTYIGNTLGVEVNTITGSLSKLINNMESAASGSGSAYDAFEKLGVSVVDGNGNLRDSNTVYMEMIAALSNVSNETERTAISQDIFGKSAADLNPLMKAGTDQLKDLAKQAKDTGAVMSGDTVTALDDFGDSLGQVKQVLQAQLGKALASFLTQITSGIEPALEKLNENQDQIKANAPKIVAAIASITAAVVAYKIASNAAEVATKGFNAVMTASPVGLAAAAVAGLVTAMVMLYDSTLKTSEPISTLTDDEKALIESAQDAAEALQNQSDASKNAADNTVAQYDHTQALWEQLQNLTDSTGRVEGAERSRAKYILGELNDALGTEYKMNGNLIVGYQDMTTEVYNLIDAQEAQALLENYKGEWVSSINEASKAEQARSAFMVDYGVKRKAVSALEQQSADEQAKITNLTNEMTRSTSDAQQKALSDQIARLSVKHSATQDTLNSEAAALADSETAYKNNEAAIKTSYQNIQKYEAAEAASLSGNTQEAIDILTGKNTAYTNSSKIIQDRMQANIDKLEQEAIEAGAKAAETKQNFENGMAGYTQGMVDEAEQGYADALSKYDNAYNDAYNATSNIGKGMVDGLTSWESAMYIESDRMAKLPKERAIFHNAIASPSKVMRKLFGYVGQGEVLGLEDYTPKLAQAADSQMTQMHSVYINKGQTLVNTMRAQMKQLQNAYDSDGQIATNSGISGGFVASQKTITQNFYGDIKAVSAGEQTRTLQQLQFVAGVG